MSEVFTQAVLVVGHGSRREEANEDVRQAAQRIRECGRGKQKAVNLQRSWQRLRLIGHRGNHRAQQVFLCGGEKSFFI